jgi:hypothetical protein
MPSATARVSACSIKELAQLSSNLNLCFHNSIIKELWTCVRSRKLSIWSLENGRSAAEAPNHVPLPANLVQQDRERLEGRPRRLRLCKWVRFDEANYAD